MRWERKNYLIGAVLVHETSEGIIKGKITECEAYGGFYQGKPDDGAHSFKGKTSRTQILFEEGGHAYIYLISFCIYSFYKPLTFFQYSYLKYRYHL